MITGETGAGKTMVVTALGLLLGGRADTGAVRTGAAAARVEGVVARRRPGRRSPSAVEEAGGEVEDDRVVLARNVSAEGRSRAFVGGASVPVSALAEVAEPLVAVHGQSDQHRLLQARARSATRWTGSAASRLAALLATYADLLPPAARPPSASSTRWSPRARERAQEADLLRFGLGEIEAVDPEPGEDATLAAEETRLGLRRHPAHRRRAGPRGALRARTATPTRSATASAARTLLDGVREHDAEAGELADRLAELTYLLSDVAADVASYAARIDTDPARLAAVSERRAALTALTRKYGETIDEVLAWAERVRDPAARPRRHRRADRGAARRAGGAARASSPTAAAALSAARTEAAGRLGRGGHRRARRCWRCRTPGSIACARSSASPRRADGPLRSASAAAHRAGVDEVELLLAANTGSEPRPLGKGASGGELSRVMLALEVALAGTSPVPTFVFDEVDAGVGGAAAVEVGRRLARLARTAQVLVVTHLPQVAAFADRHVVVEKASDGTVTSSGLTVLDDEQRERELSRMLAGHGGLRHRAGARPRAARGRPGGPRLTR